MYIPKKVWAAASIGLLAFGQYALMQSGLPAEQVIPVVSALTALFIGPMGYKLREEKMKDELAESAERQEKEEFETRTAA